MLKGFRDFLCGYRFITVGSSSRSDAADLLYRENIMFRHAGKNADGSVSKLSVDGLFIAIGLIPQNEAFANVISLDERGYASADESCVAGSNGIFVAGDCRTKKIRQVATAAADGAVAALAACDYVDSMK